ncbi:anti-phage defense-associated sirtuin Dsr2 [Pseudomaricurvus alkylphenolicus]|uniref:anti-phage defense-associated sirtuin Dsr2 n=1 Tax=Pseudomaricurvus alkylphenolicus TaxID=1306991 RepID=UPI00197E829B|nr:anti-phage defense-associated sirtuin Dsr2 [Pseudomaricurvus alkylphenolicus]
MTTDFPENVLPHLNEVSTRLWSGHAAIMVGAGFSRNATPKSHGTKSFPDWNNLGELFLQKTRGKGVDDYRFLNVLKLADEVQASLGRPALHQIIREAIPDEEYEPSELHIKLLELPWSDVLTTNYDTLLERSRTKVTTNKFDLVVRKEDLIYSEKPRIIKLHGSFPSVEPFIVTEEDYRRYPFDFAPFVNTVQQTLLENTLCLIGFSGDDPNFLRWIGWIRDNLGSDSSPKIYLVGVLNLSRAQENLLEQYNIVPIDMSEVSEIGQDHYKGIEAFLDFCQSRKEAEDKLAWPIGETSYSLDYNDKSKTKESGLIDIIRAWRGQREDYPGWLIVPEDRRSSLWRHTKNWSGCIKTEDELPSIVRLSFFYELLWRFEKCLVPIFSDNVEHVERVINELVPLFVDETKVDMQTENDLKRLDLQPWQARDAISFIILCLTRHYREEGELEKWQESISLAERFSSTQDDACKVIYERILYSLFALDYCSAKRELSSWDVHENQPYWLTKKSALLAEFGDLDEAEKLLEAALRSVRSKLNLRPIRTDYTLVSQESYILVILRYIRLGISWRKGKFSNEDRDKYSDRWNSLKQYKCDPWIELNLFESALSSEPAETPRVKVTKSFDLGRVNTNKNYGVENAEALIAYQYLKFIEEVGIPYNIPGTTFGKIGASGSAKRLQQYAPYWIVATIVRAGDKKFVDLAYNRASIHKKKVQEVDNLICKYIDVLREVLESKAFGNWAEILKKVLPEITSRLFCKCSLRSKIKAIEYLEDLYCIEPKSGYEGVRHFVDRLVASLSEEEMMECIPKLLDVCYRSELHPVAGSEFINPLSRLREVDIRRVSKRSYPEIDSEKFEELSDFLNSSSEANRLWSSCSLMKLHELGLLNQKQEDDFIVGLWSKLDQSGFPSGTGFYRFAFLGDLESPGINATELMKNHILSTPLPLQKLEKGSRVALNEGAIDICNETMGASNKLSWTREEVCRLFDIYVEWWDADKSFLAHDSQEIANEFKLRFSNLSGVLDVSISNVFPVDDELRTESLVRLISEMDEFLVPTCRIKSAFFDFIEVGAESLIFQIEAAITGMQEEHLHDGFFAVELLACRNDNESLEMVRAVKRLLGNCLVYRRRETIIRAMNLLRWLLRNPDFTLSAELERSMLFCLGQLISDTGPNSKVYDFIDSLEVRVSAAKLAYECSIYYIESDQSVPNVVGEWEIIASDSSEFSEVRNAWPS